MIAIARATRPRLTVRSIVERVRAHSLLRNSVYLMATTGATSLLGYVYWIVAARRASAYEVGVASTLIAAMMLAANIANLGIGSALVQELPKRTDARSWSLTVNAGLLAGAVAGLVAGALTVILLPLLSSQYRAIHDYAAYALAFVVTVPIWNVLSLLDQIYVAERASGNMLARNVAFAALKLALLLGAPLVMLPAGGIGVFLSWTLAAAATLIGGLLLMARRLGRTYQPALRGMLAQMRGVSKALAGHHLINLGGMAPMYLLPMIVAARISPEDGAYFYTTWMLGSLFFMVSPSVGSALFAEGAHAAHDLAGKTRQSALFIAALLTPAMLVFFVGGHTILLLFGPGYARHGLPLLLALVVSAIPDAITNIAVSVWRVRGRLRTAAGLNVGMSACAVTLAWVMIPSFGLFGAGLAWLLGQTLGCVVVAFYMLVEHNQRPAVPLLDTGSGRPDTSWAR